VVRIDRRKALVDDGRGSDPEVAEPADREEERRIEAELKRGPRLLVVVEHAPASADDPGAGFARGPREPEARRDVVLLDVDEPARVSVLVRHLDLARRE